MTCDEFREWLAEEDPDNADAQVRRVFERDGGTCPYPGCGEAFIL